MVSSRKDTKEPKPPQAGSRVDLTTTLYGELRKRAAARMADQYGTQTLQATALVHEAWLRLGGEDQPNWESREQFFAAVAKAMRHILIDRARRRQAIRHGGNLQRVELEVWNWEQMDPAKAEANDTLLLQLDEALEKFHQIDPQSAQLVKLYYFAGMSVSEAAELLEFSLRTAGRRLAYARAWLGCEIRREKVA